MAIPCFAVLSGKTFLSDEVFESRVSKNFLGHIRTKLDFDLCDVSDKHEAEALALVLGFAKNADALPDRYVFRIDRQSIEGLIDALNQFLEGGEAHSRGEVASCPFNEVV